MATCFQEALCPGIEVLPAVQMQDKQQAILFFSFLCPSQERRKYFHFWWEVIWGQDPAASEGAKAGK